MSLIWYKLVLLHEFAVDLEILQEKQKVLRNFDSGLTSIFRALFSFKALHSPVLEFGM